MKRLTRVLAPAVLLLAFLAPIGYGQVIQANIDTVDVPNRSSWENGELSLLSLDRAVLGGRALSMGGAGLALLGGTEYSSLNPAAILGAQVPELLSEARIHAGGAGINEVPTFLGEGNARLDASNYRVRPREELNYSTVSLSLPVTMLGSRGALGASYRRVAPTGAPDETRVELQGPITNQAQATYGVGDDPEQGLDAVTLTIAREVAGVINVGANLNWESGTLMRSRDVGISVFGFEILTQNSTYQQKAKGFAIDLGAQMELGKLSLAGTAYLGHDVDFTGGKTTSLYVPNPEFLDEFEYARGFPLDHTLSVPTQVGFGAAYELGERMTLAGDYWIRPWGSAEITRTRLDPTFEFADTTDVTTFGFDLVLNEKETETFSAGLEDANSLRLGLEYLLVKSPGLDVALRGGFRKEKLPISNLALPGGFDYLGGGEFNYPGLVFEQYCFDNPDGNGCQAFLDTLAVYFSQEEIAARKTRVRSDLERVLEFGQLLFRGDGVDATAITLGVGVRIQNFTADLGFERKSYDLDRFFLQAFDPLANPVASIAHESRGLIDLSLTLRMRF